MWVGEELSVDADECSRTRRSASHFPSRLSVSQSSELDVMHRVLVKDIHENLGRPALAMASAEWIWRRLGRGYDWELILRMPECGQP